MSIKQKLEEELNTAVWEELEDHFKRDALILVDEKQSLVSVGIAFFEDDKTSVEKWLADGTIVKCSPSQAKEFSSADPEMKFEYLILQPFVLAKLIKSDFH